ncbi:MAG TPA: ATP-dependent Clp protease ATP-binding subunit, partial [bacterium]|nr:ATP-dependent Clp protease ATP-binding subunit [bacterium]
MISIVRNIGYNIDIAHEYWYDFHHAGFWGLFSYLGLFASLVLLYWVVRGKEPAACLSVAQVLPHAITDTPMTWEQIRTTVPRQNIIDISKYLSYSARCLVEDALTTAERRNHRYFLPEHLVMAIFSSSLSRELQVRLDIAGKSLLNRLFSYTDNLEKRTQDTVQISKALKSALLYAAWEAIGLDTIYVNRKTLLLGAMRASQAVTDAFIEYDVHIDEVRHVVYWLDVQKEKREWWKDLTIKKFQRTGKLDRGWLGGWTLTLNKHSKDLTKAAKKGYLRRVVGREGEVEEIARILSRSTKNNALLIGEPGVGKTTLIDGLAYKIVSGQVPETLRDKRLVELNIGSVVGSAENPNQFGETMVKILAEVEKSKNVILFIPYLHTLKGAGSSNGGALDAFGILEPAFNRCAFQCIGTTTFRDYHRYIESSESFGRFFERVEIKEPDFNNTIKILEEVVLAFEAKQKVKVAYQALKAAYVLGNKYIHDKVMPDKAVDLLDEACVLVSRRKKGKRLVTESDIADVIASKTNIPVRDISTDETDKLLRLEEIMRERVIGQEEAVSAVAEAVRRARVGLKDSNRPVATFLFVGPTGVGKTELAKTLAEAYFGHEKIMVRLDMSEFHGPESIDRLIGAPPGRAGSETGGQLTEAIKKRPFSLVLLDEFEKAHSDVHNVFLQVFDDGRLTDSSGKLVDFTNSIIIATSNAGA